MTAAYSCQVVRAGTRLQDSKNNGFLNDEEKEFDAEILGFENLKAYIVRLDTKQLFWTNIENLRNVTRIV